MAVGEQGGEGEVDDFWFSFESFLDGGSEFRYGVGGVG